MSSYSAPLKRFWLVLALGVVLAAAVALTSAYSVALGFPPELTAREQPSYTAGAQLEIASPVEPYYRSAVDVPVIAPSAGDEEDEEKPNVAEQEEPSSSTLVAAANFFPYVIEGDEVRALRDRLYGEIEGDVDATAIGATITPSRYEPGRLPFIQLVATADSPDNAIALAQNTAQAFIRYVAIKQQSSRIRPAQRLIVRQLREPERTFATGGASATLPVLIFFTLLAVSVGLVFLFDRLWPRHVGTVVVADGSAREREHLVAASGHEG